ncbi:MAG: hypothetical protein RLZZ86_3479, partial [Cyanobacteriota bacterium]
LPVIADIHLILGLLPLSLQTSNADLPAVFPVLSLFSCFARVTNKPLPLPLSS